MSSAEAEGDDRDMGASQLYRSTNACLSFVARPPAPVWDGERGLQVSAKVGAHWALTGLTCPGTGSSSGERFFQSVLGQLGPCVWIRKTVYRVKSEVIQRRLRGVVLGVWLALLVMVR